jgi:hypothetical protein
LQLFSVLTSTARVARRRFGSVFNGAATFDVFPGLEVTNYGLFDIVLKSAPNNSDHVDVWLACILTQTVLPILFGEKVLPRSGGESKLKTVVQSRVTGLFISDAKGTKSRE